MAGGEKMFECILVSHGNLAEELLNTIQMIAGDVGNVKTFGLQSSQNIDDYKEQIETYLKSIEKDVIIFADLLGGSPLMSVSTLLNDLNQRAAIITGMNLPMIIEVLLQRENIDFEDALSIAHQTGIEGIKKIVKEDF